MAGHSHENHPSGGGYGRWVFWGFVLIAAYFLLTEHRAHFIEFLPFLLVLACPLMHLFHRHGSHGSKGTAPKDEQEAGSKSRSHGCH